MATVRILREKRHERKRTERKPKALASRRGRLRERKGVEKD